MTVGIYASNTDTPEALSIKNELRHILKAYPNILQLHGFYVNEEEMFVNFDLVFGFDEKDRFRVCREIEGRMKDFQSIISWQLKTWIFQTKEI